MDDFSANSLSSIDDSLNTHSSGEQNIGRPAGPGVMTTQEDWNNWMRENIALAAKKSSHKKKSSGAEESGNHMDSDVSVAFSIEKNGPDGHQTEKVPETETRTDAEERNSKEKGIVRMVCIMTCVIVLELIILFFIICRKRGILFTSTTDFQPMEGVCTLYDTLYDQYGSIGDQLEL